MNTGIQDTVNLGWKLTLVAQGQAPEALVDTYRAERHPVGAKILKTSDFLLRSLRLYEVLRHGGYTLAAFVTPDDAVDGRARPNGWPSGLTGRASARWWY